MAKITLTQTASWNASLTNGYRTRYAEAGGRYFRVSAESYDSLWLVEEIDAAGVPVGKVGFNEDGDPYWTGDLRFTFTLAGAREHIARVVKSAA